jgi:endonuclease YncB( thermonuclease family)
MAKRDITARLKFHKTLLVRGAGFAIAATSVCGALAIGSALRHPSRESTAPSVAAIEQEQKDQTRVAGGRVAEAKPVSAAANVSVWHPDRMENARALETAAAPRASAPEQVHVELREEEFASVSVVDGRTFTSNGVTIRLAGLEMPPPDQVCRTLDNRLEQCAARAATQLELLTRSRRLACRYRMTTSSEGVGSCRIGTIDLAERLVRTGYVRVADAGRTVIANAGQSASSR